MAAAVAPLSLSYSVSAAVRGADQSTGSHRQQYLADVIARFHAGMGLGRIGQRKRRIDYRLDPPGLNRRPDPVLERRRDRRLRFAALWPEG